MFQQPIKVKSETILKGTERKKLRVDIQKQWLLFSAEMVKELIPSRVELTVYRINTATSEYVTIYIHQSQPILFEYNEVFYPTVYTAWRFSSYMVTLTAWSSYAPKLMAGEDLPLQAIQLSTEEQSRISQYVQPGRPCCIATTETSKSAIAVGSACLSGTRMLLNVAKGNAFVTMHCYGDQLWAVGRKGRPPWVLECPPPGVKFPEKRASTMDSLQRSMTSSNLGSIHRGSSSARRSLPESVHHASERANITELDGKVQKASLELDSAEEKLYICTLNAIKCDMKELKLPMDALQFYLQCTKCCKNRNSFDTDPVKPSEKIIAFLKKLEQRKLLVIQSTRKLNFNIISVNYEHQDVQSYKSSDHDELQTSKTEPLAPYQPPEITELFSVNSATLPLLSKLGFRRGDTLTKCTLQGALNKYVAANNLQPASKTYIEMDKLLTQTLCGEKVKIINTRMNLAEILDRLSKKMDKVYQLIFPHGPVVLRKSAPTVQISLNTNSNKEKSTTLIRHLDRYRLDMDSFVKEIRLAKQCSATLTARQGSSLVVAMGNHIAFIYKTLKDKYRIPATYIDLV